MQFCTVHQCKTQWNLLFFFICTKNCKNMSSYFPATWLNVAKKRRRAYELSYANFILLFSSGILYWFCFHEMSITTCKSISLNVRGISNFKKRKTIFTWCRKQKANFIISSRNPLKNRLGKVLAKRMGRWNHYGSWELQLTRGGNFS